MKTGFRITADEQVLASQMAAAALPHAGWVQTGSRALGLLCTVILFAWVSIPFAAGLSAGPAPTTALSWTIAASTACMALLFLHSVVAAYVERRRIGLLPSQPSSIEITDEALLVQDALGTHIYPWRALDRVTQDGKYAFIYHRPNGITLVPARDFKDPREFVEFCGTVARKLSAAAQHDA